MAVANTRKMRVVIIIRRLVVPNHQVIIMIYFHAQDLFSGELRESVSSNSPILGQQLRDYNIYSKQLKLWNVYFNPTLIGKNRDTDEIFGGPHTKNKSS